MQRSAPHVAREVDDVDPPQEEVGERRTPEAEEPYEAGEPRAPEAERLLQPLHRTGDVGIEALEPIGAQRAHRVEEGVRVAELGDQADPVDAWDPDQNGAKPEEEPPPRAHADDPGRRRAWAISFTSLIGIAGAHLMKRRKRKQKVTIDSEMRPRSTHVGSYRCQLDGRKSRSSEATMITKRSSHIATRGGADHEERERAPTESPEPKSWMGTKFRRTSAQ